MVLGKLDITCRRMKLDQDLMQDTKITRSTQDVLKT